MSKRGSYLGGSSLWRGSAGGVWNDGRRGRLTAKERAEQYAELKEAKARGWTPKGKGRGKKRKGSQHGREHHANLVEAKARRKARKQPQHDAHVMAFHQAREAARPQMVDVLIDGRIVKFNKKNLAP